MKSILSLLAIILFSIQLSAQRYEWLEIFSSDGWSSTNQQVEVRGNNVYVAGEFRTSISFGTTTLTADAFSNNLFLAKFDTLGNLKWALKGGIDSTYEQMRSMTLDSMGNVYIAATYGGDSTQWDTVVQKAKSPSGWFWSSREGYIVKINPSGKAEWIRGIYSPGNNLDWYSVSKLSSAGNSIYLSGSTNDTIKITGTNLQLNKDPIATGRITYVAKLDVNGNTNLIKPISDNNRSWWNTVTDLEATSDSTFFISGITQGIAKFGRNLVGLTGDTTTNGNVYVAKFTNDSCEWLVNSENTNPWWWGFPVQLEVLNNGDVYFAGAFRDTITFQNQTINTDSTNHNNFYIGKLNGNGSLLKLRRIGVNQGQFNDIARNSKDELLLVGQYSGIITLNSITTISNGSYDILVINMDTSLDINWYQTGGGGSWDYGLSVGSSNSPNFYVTGTFNGLSQFGSSFYTGNTLANSSLLFKMSECGTTEIPVLIKGDTNLCVGDDVRLQFESNGLGTFQWLKDSAKLTGELFRDLVVDSTGVYQIIVNAAGCVDTSRGIQVTVGKKPTMSLALVDTVCQSDDAFVLTGGLPLGGTYSGFGVTDDSIFTPSTAGIGRTEITYKAFAGGCGDSLSEHIYVKPTPTVFFAPIPDVCISSSPVTLVNAFPFGGTFSGIGVSGGKFDPSIAGAGVHDITYTYSDANGCSDSVTRTVQVDTLILANLSILPTVCEQDSSFSLSSYASPSGGVFKGVGVSNGRFDPSISGDGTFTINYITTSLCGNDTASQSITVHPAPNVSLNSFSAVCENDAAFTLTGGSPANGTYSGVGVSSGMFDPSIAGVGTFKIYYQFTDGIGCSAMDSADITVDALPNIGLTPDTSICDGASIDLIASGGSSYSWSNGDITATSTVSPTTTTKYYVTVTNANNCQSVDSVSVVVNPNPTASISGNFTICEGSSTDLTASGGSSYSWSNGDITAISTVSPMISTTYTVTVSDANQCSATASQLVTVNPAPNVSLNSFSAVCENDAAFTLTGGSPANGTYSGVGVSSGMFDPSIAGVGTFKIYYQFTDGIGCSAMDSADITVDALPNIGLTPDTSICDGASIDLIASGGSSYSWSNGDVTATSTVSPTTTTKYYVTVTNANNCQSVDSVSVVVNPNPTASISGNFTICEGSSTDLTASGGSSYSWSNGDITAISTVSPMISTTYTVTVSDANQCSATASQLVTVNPAPNVSLNSFSAVCENDAAFTLTGGSPANGTYSGVGVSSGMFDPSIAGVGTFKIYYQFTDGIGCSAMDSADITVDALPNIGLTPDTSICDGASIDLIASGGSSYSWSNGDITATSTVSPTTTTKYYVTVTNANNCQSVDSVSVVVNPNPTASISGNFTICEGSSTDLTASGGSSYSWSNGDITAISTVSPMISTTYTVTVSDANQCSATASQLVTVNPAPNVSLNSFSAVCENDAAFTLTGGSPANGTYSGVGVSSGMFDPSIAGVGTFKIYYQFTDGIGCSAMDSADITVDALPNIGLTPDTSICDGASIDLIASGGSSYSWSNGDVTATSTVSPTTTTKYYVTVTNANNCQSVDSVSVVVNPNPTASISGNFTICEGSSTDLTASGGSSYSWSNGDITAISTVSPMISTTYTVTVSDANQCSATASQLVTVNPAPNVSLNSFSAVCENDAAFTLTGGSPANGTYSGVGVSNGMFDPSIAGVGTFKIYYQFTDGIGCSAMDSADITVETLQSITLTPNTSICNGDSIDLVASGGSSYSWSNGDNTATSTVKPTSTTKYYVTVTNTANCQKVDSVTVSVLAKPILTLPNDTSICLSDSITLTASSSSNNYLWSNGGLSASIKVSPAQTTVYYLSSFNGSGCYNIDSVLLTINTGTPINIGPDTTLKPNGPTFYTYDAGAGYQSYKWQDNSSNQTLTINYNGLKAGTYDTVSVIVENTSGCPSVDTALVFHDFTISLEDIVESDPFVTVFPNPFRDLLFIKFKNPSSSSQSIRLFDVNGKLILEEELEVNTLTHSINLESSEISKGLYFLQIVNGENNVMKKVIKD